MFDNISSIWDRKNSSRKPRAGGYALLVVGVVLIAAAGYAGYVLYPRFDLPAVTGAELFVLAATGGIASFFSPCSFPLLVTLLARETGMRADRKRTHIGKALGFASSLSLGTSVFLLLAGTVVAIGGGAFFEEVTFTSTLGKSIRIAVGIFLFFLGTIQTGIIPVSFHAVEEAARPMQRAQARLRRKHPVIGFALFGFGYVIAGFG